MLKDSIYPWLSVWTWYPHGYNTQTPETVEKVGCRWHFCECVPASLSVVFSGTVRCEERLEVGICISFSDSKDWNSHSEKRLLHWYPRCYITLDVQVHCDGNSFFLQQTFVSSVCQVCLLYSSLHWGWTLTLVLVFGTTRAFWAFTS